MLVTKISASQYVNDTVISLQVHYLQEATSDYIRAAVSAAVEIHKVDLPGDILVFLTGQVRRDQRRTGS